MEKKELMLKLIESKSKINDDSHYEIYIILIILFAIAFCIQFSIKTIYKH